MKISEHDRMRLAVETKLSLGVVHRWVKSGNITASNKIILDRAAVALDIKTSDPDCSQINESAKSQ